MSGRIMRFTWTKHASESLVERKIDPGWVERIVLDPAWREPDSADPELERLFGQVSEAGGRTMRVVVCFKAADRCRVITLFFDRDARGDER